MSEALLRADKASIVFGGLKAVSDFDLYINRGELVGLIGPNGAGKTTAFNLITGVYQPTSGDIMFDGRSIAGKKPYGVTATLTYFGEQLVNKSWHCCFELMIFNVPNNVSKVPKRRMLRRL